MKIQKSIPYKNDTSQEIFDILWITKRNYNASKLDKFSELEYRIS
ncbi:hypothetical protein FLAVO9R_70126 [Flavobacterium sp. 9R]|nr:hypothetical protein FLAVO9R_70126 [Flavobacterium sp. 9R]